MESGGPRRNGYAFARTVWRSLWVSVAVAGFICLVGGCLLVRGFTRKAVVAQARTCAAALVPTMDGDLSSSIDRVLASTGDVAAIATLDASGRLNTLYPERSAYRRAAAATLDNGGGPLATTIELDGERRRLWGAVVPLNSGSSPTSRRVLLLLHDDPYAGLGLSLTILLVVCFAVISLLAGRTIIHWYDLRIAAPLARLHYLVSRPGQEGPSRPNGSTDTDASSTTTHGVLEALSRYVTASEAWNRSLQREAARQVRDREVRFRHRLRRAEDRATTDALTRLRNRAFLEEELDRIIARQRESGRDLALVMIDVDNFKAHNDAYGHRAGDDCLRFIGALLRGSIRPIDHAIRFGGDEFVLVLPGVGDEDAHAIADRIVKMFAQWAASIGSSLPPSLSAGVAMLQRGSEADRHALLARADEALYAGKRAGKNTVSSR